MQKQLEKSRVRERTRHHDFLYFALIVAAVAIPVIAALTVYSLYSGSLDSIQALGLNFLTGTLWIPNPPNGGPPILGALPAMYGSIVTTLIALLFAVPISLGVALFQSELAPRSLRLPSIFLVELLAAVPSVVYGLWGLFFLVPFMRDYIDPGLIGSLGGFIPIFSGETNGLGMLTAGLILAIMITPYASAVMREVVAAVPRSQREACVALGGTRLETIRMAVVPYASTGIIAAIVLAMGRAIGETMAVIMVIGNVARITPSLFLPAETIPSVIANEFTEVAGNNIYLAALFELGLILFAIAFLMNLVGRVLISRLSFHPGRSTDV
ncbi:MAG: phosphate ABC transporter permease subunit PstC [Candidatus Bathyarchaeia archaeon]